jgi:hemerythrin-like domain-containing protein
VISALQTIRIEHHNIASVLYCLRYLLGELDKGRWAPDFELFDIILDYMATFPEAMHHPKEEDYLLAAMQRRKPDTAQLVAVIHDEHVKGGELLKALRGRFEDYRADPASFADFKAAAEDYIDFERRHMAREERELLPLALQVLQDEDWKEIDAAFGRDDDPLFGTASRKEFQKLIHYILELAPTPLGFRERGTVKA